MHLIWLLQQAELIILLATDDFYFSAADSVRRCSQRSGILTYALSMFSGEQHTGIHTLDELEVICDSHIYLYIGNDTAAQAYTVCHILKFRS